MLIGKPSPHAEILEYALSHLEAERDKIQAKIDVIRRELGTSAPANAVKTAPAVKKASARKNAAAAAAVAEAPAGAPRKKRVLSEVARKRIAAAQKRRWAEHRKKQKAE